MARLPFSDRNPDVLRDALAVRYVLGTLRGPARTRLERITESDAELRHRIDAWERALEPLLETLPAVAPRPQVWEQIRTQLGHRLVAQEGTDRRPPQQRSSLWGNLAFWRGAAVAAGAFATMLLATLISLRGGAPTAPPPASVLSEPAMVAVLADAATHQPMLLVSATKGADELVIQSIGAAAPASDKSLELWALPPGAPPRSLGVLADGGRVRLRLAAPVDQTLSAIPALAISLEPRGGSPTGQPTGPVLYSGAIVRL
jgi:anti-sigma-K factor RskA